MDFSWVITGIGLLIAFAVIAIVIASWVTSLERWEQALAKPTAKASFKNTFVQNLPAIVGLSILLLVVLIFNNNRIQSNQRYVEKVANDRAIAAANAVALAKAGITDSAIAKQSGAEGASKDDGSLSASASRQADLQKKLAEAKQAQKEVNELLKHNAWIAKLANLAITVFLALVISASMASFFAAKTSRGKARIDSTWILYFLVFLAMTVTAFQSIGGIQVFKESAMSALPTPKSADPNAAPIPGVGVVN